MARQERPTIPTVTTRVLNELYATHNDGQIVPAEIATLNGAIETAHGEQHFKHLKAKLPKKASRKTTAAEVDLTLKVLNTKVVKGQAPEDLLNTVRDQLREQRRQLLEKDAKTRRRRKQIIAAISLPTLVFGGVRAYEAYQDYDHAKQTVFERTHQLGETTTLPSQSGWRAEAAPKGAYENTGDYEILKQGESLIIPGINDEDTNITFEKHDLTTGEDTTKVIVLGEKDEVKQEVLLEPAHANTLALKNPNGTTVYYDIGRASEDDLIVAEPVTPVPPRS